MSWSVTVSRKAEKQTDRLPPRIRKRLFALAREIHELGPERVNWPHYGRLKGQGSGKDLRHCHLNNGRPTYVTVWEVKDKRIRLVEVTYVGTHENAPY